MGSDSDQKALHRSLGIEYFNAAWDLIDQAERSADDGLEMLLLAAASRLHWQYAGGGTEELATGDWQVAHVASILGHGGLALAFAKRNLEVATRAGWRGWRLGSAHEGMARAAATAGDASLRDEHVAAAHTALADEPDAEARGVVAGQLETVPR
jgi:hypothetical protein